MARTKRTKGLRSSSVVPLRGLCFFAIQEAVRLHREPAVLGVTLIAASLLFTIWPDRITREAVRSSLHNALFLLFPLAIFTAIVVAVHFAAQMPPGFFGSAGMSLALLGTYKAMLANSASRGDAQLGRARNWLRRELKSPTPRLRDDAIPWLNALGLQDDIARWQRRNHTAESRFRSTQWTGNPPPEPEEELERGDRPQAAHMCSRSLGPTGLEPATSGVTARCAIALNYSRSQRSKFAAYGGSEGRLVLTVHTPRLAAKRFAFVCSPVFEASVHASEKWAERRARLSEQGVGRQVTFRRILPGAPPAGRHGRQR
jgi:hypothetical protein